MENKLEEGHETGDRETGQLGAIVLQGRVDEGLKGAIKHLSTEFNQYREPPG